MTDAPQSKIITGYCEPLSLRAGDKIHLMASSHRPGLTHLDLVRIVCGDPARGGPGFRDLPLASALPAEVLLQEQRLVPGSYAEVDLARITANVVRRFVEAELFPIPADDGVAMVE